MGQTPPGTTAEVFAPGVISGGGWELEGVFAPGMEEFYFVTKGGEEGRPTIIGFRFEDDGNSEKDDFWASVTPDGGVPHVRPHDRP
jgi:hypothetical protein